MPQSTISLAQDGYFEAMRLMAAGRLASVRFWRPEALEMYREPLRNGENDAWMEQFNRDLRDTVGPSYSAKFIGPEHAEYPTLEASEGAQPAIVILLTRVRGQTARTIVRPYAKQVLTSVRAFSLF